MFLSLVDTFEKTLLKLGFSLIYDNVDEVHDYVDHWLYIFGIYLWERKIINNKVVFSKKTGKSRVKLQIINYGFCLFFIIAIGIGLKTTFNHELSRYYIVYVVMIIMNTLTVAIGLICLTPFGDCLEEVRILQNDADYLIKQLLLPPVYRVPILLAIVVQILIYCYLLLLTVYCVFKMFVAGNFIKTLIEYVLVVLAVVVFVTIGLFYGGNCIICAVRSWKINKLLKNVVYKKKNKFCSREHFLYQRRSLNFILENVKTIQEKQSQLLQVSENYSILPLMCMIRAYAIEASFLLYEYFFENRTEPIFLSVSVLGTIAFTGVTFFKQMYKYESNKTLSIIIDWEICYFDEEMLNLKTSLLMQDLHYDFNVRYNLDGIMSFTPSVWIAILELTISLLVYLIQSLDSAQ